MKNKLDRACFSSFRLIKTICFFYQTKFKLQLIKKKLCDNVITSAPFFEIEEVFDKQFLD